MGRMSRSTRYLDHAATTPLAPEVLQAMLPHFQDDFGNASSIHSWGQRAERALEDSRRRIAAQLGCQPAEIIFTSGGSESDNLALRGAALAARRQRQASRVLVSPVEHPAVLETAQRLAADEGFALDLLRVDGEGRVDPQEVRRCLRPDTAVVSVMYANNEIGTINPVAEIAALCRQQGVPFHSDAVQAASQLALDVSLLGVDLLSIGAHKFYGPKGVGALFVREGTLLANLQTGGGQEFGMRAGTENVPLIVGMAEALDLTVRTREVHNLHFSSLRDRLLARIPELISSTRITGHPRHRLPNHASFALEQVDGHALVVALDLAGFACSSGSACKTGDPRPSNVLLGIGLPPALALGSLRLSVGRSTTSDDVEDLLAVLPEIVARQRAAHRTST
jgi:cysteine desulfurase